MNDGVYQDIDLTQEWGNTAVAATNYYGSEAGYSFIRPDLGSYGLRPTAIAGDEPINDSMTAEQIFKTSLANWINRAERSQSVSGVIKWDFTQAAQLVMVAFEPAIAGLNSMVKSIFSTVSDNLGKEKGDGSGLGGLQITTAMQMSMLFSDSSEANNDAHTPTVSTTQIDWLMSETLQEPMEYDSKYWVGNSFQSALFKSDYDKYLIDIAAWTDTYNAILKQQFDGDDRGIEKAIAYVGGRITDDPANNFISDYLRTGIVTLIEPTANLYPVLGIDYAPGEKFTLNDIKDIIFHSYDAFGYFQEHGVPPIMPSDELQEIADKEGTSNFLAVGVGSMDDAYLEAFTNAIIEKYTSNLQWLYVYDDLAQAHEYNDPPREFMQIAFEYIDLIKQYFYEGDLFDWVRDGLIDPAKARKIGHKDGVYELEFDVNADIAFAKLQTYLSYAIDAVETVVEHLRFDYIYNGARAAKKADPNYVYKPTDVAPIHAGTTNTFTITGDYTKYVGKKAIHSAPVLKVYVYDNGLIKGTIMEGLTVQFRFDPSPELKQWVYTMVTDDTDPDGFVIGNILGGTPGSAAYNNFHVEFEMSFGTTDNAGNIYNPMQHTFGYSDVDLLAHIHGYTDVDGIYGTAGTTYGGVEAYNNPDTNYYIPDEYLGSVLEREALEAQE
jgi:hypothetical protein